VHQSCCLIVVPLQQRGHAVGGGSLRSEWVLVLLQRLLAQGSAEAAVRRCVRVFKGDGLVRMLTPQSA
jgi:hypothetical protein